MTFSKVKSNWTKKGSERKREERVRERAQSEREKREFKLTNMMVTHSATHFEYI